ncbi:hypothetical protein [Nocardia salmonicida]|uniref:hypothetical protein n=1 Tax=Nocardia salmonicida TaxID=53431 RepID=UPI000ACB7682|nr:hypothetical protein [Nocardia salmonicida]
MTHAELYIASAAMTDTARAEPPFQLQGSYRDMNGLTGRIVTVMNGRRTRNPDR